MSVSRIDVGQLRIVMHGVTPEAAQTVAAGLEAALVARLGALRSVPVSSRIEEVHLGALEVAPTMDERAIIDAIASRLLDSLEPTTREAGAGAGAVQ